MKKICHLKLKISCGNRELSTLDPLFLNGIGQDHHNRTWHAFCYK